MTAGMSMVPDHLRRYPTQAARRSLAARLGLPFDSTMQDWEWEVAAARHFPAWLALYERGELSDDERFSLMEMLVQCVEDMAWQECTPDPSASSREWQAVAALLRANWHLHASTIWYWSVFDYEEPNEVFRVSRAMRQVWQETQSSIGDLA